MKIRPLFSKSGLFWICPHLGRLNAPVSRLVKSPALLSTVFKKLDLPCLQRSYFVVFPFCMVFAAVSDLLSMTIANRVSIILAAAFLLVAPMTGMDWSAYLWHISAGILVLCVTFGLFAVGGHGRW